MIVLFVSQFSYFRTPKKSWWSTFISCYSLLFYVFYVLRHKTRSSANLLPHRWT